MRSRRSFCCAAVLAAVLAPLLAGCGGDSKTVSEFGKYGSGAGEFKEPFGIGVDQGNGDVYVVDTDNYRVEKFTSSGRFLLAWGWGVADGRTEALQTCTSKCYQGREGGGPGQFQFSEGVAVDNDPGSSSRGDVYVVDILNRRVEKFGPTGKFLLMFGGAVNHTAVRDHDAASEDVCVAGTADVCGPGVEGPGERQLELAVEGSFIAVGSNGLVYLGQRNRVKVFSPEGVYLSQVKLTPPPGATGPEAGGVSGLAVDRAGDMYVIRNDVFGIDEYSPSGKLMRNFERYGEPSFAEGPTPSLALDPAGNLFVDVYYHYRHHIDELSPNGRKIGSFDEGPPGSLPAIADREDGLPGIAYDPRTRKLYLVNADVNLRPRVERVRIVSPPRP
jgi:tripartite motif-containing protein 71